MPNPSILSPNTGNLQVGKGRVSFKREGTSIFRYLGNVTQMVVTPDMTTLEHFSSMEGVKKKDLTIIIEKKSLVKMTMEEKTPDNIALMLLGEIDYAAVGGPEIEIFSQNAINGHLRFEGTNEVGPKETMDLYYVSFLPSGDYGLISDEWNSMDVEADVLVAPAGDPNVGKFGILKMTNLAAVVAPTFTSILPVTGPAAGGTAVTITGTGFASANAVTFDLVSIVDGKVISDTQITGKTPPGTIGTADLLITNGAANVAGAAAFTYA